MAWHKIGNGKHFYFHKRINGKLIVEYIRDPEEIAQVESLIIQRRQNQARLRAFEVLDSPGESILKTIANQIDKCYKLYKVMLGFRFHHNEWRRTLEMNAISQAEIDREMNRLIAKGEYQFTDELVLINKYNANHPMRALNALLDSMPGLDECGREAYRRGFFRLKKSLVTEGKGSVLESLLASRIAMEWVSLHHTEVLSFRYLHEPDIRLQNFLDLKLTRATKRLMKSIKMLSDINHASTAEIQSKLAKVKLAG